MAYPSNMMPVVGQQVTLESSSGQDAFDRAELLIARASLGDCDLVVKGRVQGEPRGYVLDDGMFLSDRSSEPAVSNDALQALIGDATESLTYLCAPPGSGWRIGIDRDADGFADWDERDAGSDPTLASSVP
jgi:hypothetical protein